MKVYTDINAIIYLLYFAKQYEFDLVKLRKALNERVLPVQFVSLKCLRIYKALMKHILFGTNSGIYDFFITIRCTDLRVYSDLMFICNTRNTDLAFMFPLTLNLPSTATWKRRQEKMKAFEAGALPMSDEYTLLVHEQLKDEHQEEAYQEYVLNEMTHEPDEHWKLYTVGYLIVKTGPEASDTEKKDPFTCLCRACGSLVQVSWDELQAGACPSCVEALGLSDFDYNAKLAHVTSVVIDRQDRIRAAGFAFGKENLIKSMLKEGIGVTSKEDGSLKYASNAQVIKASQAKYVEYRWRIGTEKSEEALSTTFCTIRWAGLPLSSFDQLHRIGHQQDDWTEKTPYSKDTVMWLSSKSNKALKCTNHEVSYNGIVHPSLRSACAAAKVKPETVRQRIKRDPSKNPQQHFDAVVAVADPI